MKSEGRGECKADTYNTIYRSRVSLCLLSLVSSTSSSSTTPEIDEARLSMESILNFEDGTYTMIWDSDV